MFDLFLRFRPSFRQLLALCLCALLIWQAPVQAVHFAPSLQAANQARPVQSRALPPHKDLPNIKDLLDEGKGIKQTKAKDTPLKESNLCGYRDVICQEAKKGKKFTANAAPSREPYKSQVAQAEKKSDGGWLRRFGRGLTNTLTSVTSGSLGHSSGNSFLPASLASAPPPPPPPPSFSTLKEAKLDPYYRIGTGGEDLFSGNYHWSTTLVSLPGRNGLDLNITLDYNSLVWVRYLTTMYFEPDYYPSLTPGFRLGFPEIESSYSYDGGAAYLVTLPSGRRVPMRYVGRTGAGSKYEAVDSSNLYLSAGSQTILYAPNGTQFIYAPTSYTGLRVAQIKDSNGNQIDITYGVLGISTITDTLGRVITFNYDANYHLTTITQNWNGAPHTLAQFDYDNRPLEHNFGGLSIQGPAPYTQIPVITRVITSDGARHVFVYNKWGIVDDIFLYGASDNQRAAADYGFPSTTQSLDDCPRFTQRNDGIWGFAGQWNDGLGWVANYFDIQPASGYGQVKTPDGVVHKELFGTTGGTHGLTTGMETWVGMVNWSGGMKKKWTTASWVSDSSNKPLRPRVVETNVYDDVTGQGTVINQRRTTIGYTTINLLATPYTTTQPTKVYLPSQVTEYAANTTTPYRTTETDYSTDVNYFNRRIIGLPIAQRLKDGANVLQAQTTYAYDQIWYTEHDTPVIQHDTANYGSPFFLRGNVTSTYRYKVENGVASDPNNPNETHETQTWYYLTGNVYKVRDVLGHETKFFYDDSFATYADDVNNTETVYNPATKNYAYLTQIQSPAPESYSSYVKYWYDTGAVTRTTDPKGAAAINIYETTYGRLLKSKNVVNGAYTRYVYTPDHNYVQTWSTINDATETAVLHLLDGAGRERQRIDEHPGSVGTLSSSYRVYDNMGRVVEWSNPTEISSSNWAPTGDDAAPLYVISTQTYDWNHRPLVTTNQDLSQRAIDYTGCGCAGGQVITVTDEVNRVQKIYHDVLGRVIKTEGMNGTNVYSTVTTTYNVRDQVTEYKQIVGSSGADLSATSEYDGYGRLWRSKLPIEGANTTGTVYQYNADDSVQSVTDPRGVTTSFTYNNRGLVQSITFNPNGAPNVAPFGPVNFTYDSAGNRLTMTDSSGSSEYHYDTLSQMDWEKRHFNGLTQDYYIYYQYNLAGQVKEIKDHFNDVTYYNYDKTGRVVSVTGADLTRGEQYQYTSSNSNSLIKYRAWNGVKQFKYGNNIQTNLTYDARLRNQIFEITGKVQNSWDPDPSPLAMKTEAEYYSDNQLRYVTDHKDQTFNRAFKWDHLGRMEEAYSGTEADAFANKPQSGVLGPYRQSYQHDQFGRMTQRTTRFWSKNDTLNVSYDAATGRNQNPTWQYDAAGKLTQDENLKYFYNAAGISWQLQDLAGVPKKTREFDGVGNIVRDTHFYLNSTVLGGLPIAEIYQLDGKKDIGNIYLGGERIAELKDGTGGAWNPPDKWVIWDHSNPVTGSDGRSTELAWYFKESEPDPMGVNVGFEDPFISPDPPPDPDVESGIPGLLSGPGETGRKCELDGIIVDCGFIPVEGVVRAPDKTTEPLYNKTSDGKLQFKGYAHFNSGLNGYETHLIQTLKIMGEVVGWWIEKGPVIPYEGWGGLGQNNSDKPKRRRVPGNKNKGSRPRPNQGVKKPVVNLPPVNPALKNPCYGLTDADLDYSLVQEYDEDGHKYIESAQDHIFRRHVVPKSFLKNTISNSQRNLRLLMTAGASQRSIYVTQPFVDGSVMFDHIRAVNAQTFNLGTVRMHTNNNTGAVEYFIFEYAYTKPEPGLDGKVHIPYVGFAWDPKSRTVSQSNVNTLILHPDCKTVRTSFPGRVP